MARTVHPRVCGEHWRAIRRPRCGRGSSPRVRGTRPFDARPGPIDRFIPACAGNTGSGRVETMGCPVHPRVCGEHQVAAEAGDDFAGSSPRVRGTPVSAGHEQRRERFIPACAGNTPACEARLPRVPVHPRVCGEHTTSPSRTCAPCGSSPRVRGTPTIRISYCIFRRFIPACAGNTSRRDRVGDWDAVHPRVCGEHPGVLGHSRTQHGSSPRVRGTQRDHQRHQPRDRFIPACAGNTFTHAIGGL